MEFDFFDDATHLTSVSLCGITYSIGDRVRLHPKAGADVMDLLLAGRTGIIEAVEQDFENRIYLAIVLDDDPGRELGLMRQPGHRFFYAPDEVELLGANA